SGLFTFTKSVHAAIIAVSPRSQSANRLVLLGLNFGVEDLKPLLTFLHPNARAVICTRHVLAFRSLLYRRTALRHWRKSPCISASGLQRRSRPTRGSLPGASARENGTSRTRPPYGPRLALHTISGHIETDR